MTKDADFKQVVRRRMEKTGESYAAARAQLVKQPDTRIRHRGRMENPVKGWYFFLFPSALLGTRRQTRIKGTINGKPFRARARPVSDEQHCIPVNVVLRSELGVQPEDELEMVFEIDTEPLQVAIPDDLAEALRATAGAEAAFTGMAYSHRKEYVRWIEQARRPETRARRIEQTVERVRAGKGFR